MSREVERLQLQLDAALSLLEQVAGEPLTVNGVPGGTVLVRASPLAPEIKVPIYMSKPTTADLKAFVETTRRSLVLSERGKLPKTASYMSPDGIMQVPERIMIALGLGLGGGVVFLDRHEKGIEVMSDSKFAVICDEMFGGIDPEGEP